jgi:predicted transcriptional regulator
MTKDEAIDYLIKETKHSINIWIKEYLEKDDNPYSSAYDTIRAVQNETEEAIKIVENLKDVRPVRDEK